MELKTPGENSVISSSRFKRNIMLKYLRQVAAVAAA